MTGNPRYVKQGNGQAQDALAFQMARVLQLANQHGEYDAADWIARAYWGENMTADEVIGGTP